MGQPSLGSYVIPFRDGPCRTPGLSAVLHWLAGFGEALEVVVVEQDAEPRLADQALPANARHVFTYNVGPFNRSWGLNVGFRQAHGDVVALADADLILHPAVLAGAFASCRQHYDAVRPFGALVDLDADETARVLAGGSVDLHDLPAERLNRQRSGEVLCFCGGAYLVRRAVYDRVGGQDERFLGWGGEDDAMSIKLQKLGCSLGVIQEGLACHLHHPRRLTPALAKDPHYRDNVALLLGYRRSTPRQLEQLAQRQRRTMGRLDKHR